MLISFQWNGQIVREPWVVGVDDRHHLGLDGEPAADAVDQVYAPVSASIASWPGLCGGILVMLLIIWPWATLTVGLLIYVATIPVAVVVHHPAAKAQRAALHH